MQGEYALLLHLMQSSSLVWRHLFLYSRCDSPEQVTNNSHLSQDQKRHSKTWANKISLFLL